jgi:methylated-DNA-[protein]-cysteine S-methyltransferase
MFYSIFDTSLGSCGIVYRSVKQAEVVHIFLPQSEKENLNRLVSQYPSVRQADSPLIERLSENIVRFLEGEDVSFSMDLMDTSVCYPFQLEVISTERTIPRGMTATYGWVAKQINTKGVRAVGSALARNPFPLVVPCHRAIRSDRTLGGFQGGLGMKRRLLEMEGIEFDSRGRVQAEHILT